MTRDIHLPVKQATKPKGKLPPFYLRLRFATALIATWLLNFGMFGYSLKSLCAPSFYCHGCPWALTACPVGAIAFGSAMRALPVFAIASVLAVGVALGRLACGFLCPFGLLQDLLYRLPGRKIRLPRFFRYGKYVALVLLVLALPWALGLDPPGYLKMDKPTVNKAEGGNISVALNVQNLGTEPVRSPQVVVSYRAHETQTVVYRETRDFAGLSVAPGQTVALPTFEVPNRLAEADLAVESPQGVAGHHAPFELYYCRLCPNGTLTATIPAYWADPGRAPLWTWTKAHAVRLAILGGFLGLMVVSSRPVCRLFCPLGAMYALTTRAALTRMRVDKSECIDCEKCDKACPLELDVRREVGGPECIACGDCIKVCPRQGIRREVGV